MTTETPPDWVLLEAAKRAGIKRSPAQMRAGQISKAAKPYFRALCDMIQQHEAFKQEVSKAMTYTKALYPTLPTDYDRFIIPKSDPLAEVLEAIGGDDAGYCDYNIYAALVRAGLEARGLEIRGKQQ
jgi:hypothetical protein